MRKKSSRFTMTAILAGMMVTSVASAENRFLTVQLGGLDKGGRVADHMAFCPPASSKARNISPEVSWSPGPEGTRSYALLMLDPDVPQDFSQINKPNTVISADASRISIHHWVLADIPKTITTLSAGAESEGVVARGKPIGATANGLRGANVFTTFLAKDETMAGTYGGYDGPCPPTNDERVHHYVFRVFALDVPSLGLSGAFDGEAVEKAMRGHVLAQGEVVATYTLNP